MSDPFVNGMVVGAGIALSGVFVGAIIVWILAMRP
jgi:hypothetical protein